MQSHIDKQPSSKRSQIESTPYVMELLTKWGISTINTPEDLITLKEHLYATLKRLPYYEKTIEAEAAIRWKRTGAQVLEDGYVYKTKSCTDIIVAFITLIRATGTKNTRFVKLKNTLTGLLHSVAEIELPDGWYIYDVSDMTAVPKKGEITADAPYVIEDIPGEFKLWKKGRDSWDLDLNDYESGLMVDV